MGRGDLEYRSLDVAGVRRGYWLARGPDAASPLLMVLHGSGISGKDVATTFSGLATRGPAAGVTAVFPDGWHEVWHITRPPPGEPGLDDAAFLRALVGELGGTPVFLAGSPTAAGSPSTWRGTRATGSVASRWPSSCRWWPGTCR